MSAATRNSLLDDAQRELARGRARDAEELCLRLLDTSPKDAAGWHLLGLVRQKLGRTSDAVQAFVKASALERGEARYHHDLGSALADDGKLDRAITSFRRALRIDDSRAGAHNDLGTAYFEKQWYPEAEACFRKAIEFKPDHGVAHANLGAALRAQGRLRDGRRAFQRALVLKIRASLPGFLQWRIQGGPMSKAENDGPEDPDALYGAAKTLEDQQDFENAIRRVEAAIRLKPGRAEYHIAHARLLVGAVRTDDALLAAERALKLEPGAADVHAAISAIYHPWREDLAEEAARRAVEIDANSPAGHANLAAALWGQGRPEEAERHARTALDILPSALNYRMNLALILKDQSRLDEARMHYRAMIGEAPDHPGICINMGTLALQCDGDLEAARGWFARAQAQREDPRATLSDAIVDLLEGRFDIAWQKYEARKRVAEHRDSHTRFTAIPTWNGHSLPAGRLLVYGEQGLGDEIMFSSMLLDLARRGARIELLCDPRLEKFFARSFSGIRVVSTARDSKPEIAADVECAIAAGSLGLHLRRSPTEFPAREGYLQPDEQKVAAWRARFEALGPGRKIGISWMGGVVKTGRARRSFALAQLRPLLEIPGITWVSLQHGDYQSEIDAFAAASGIRVHNFPKVTEDIDNLASLIQALDQVVSVCNTTVHIAGAIGKEVLVMAPFLPEWRYGMRGERMLWYPSARVFRQPAFGEWEGVIASVARALAERQA